MATATQFEYPVEEWFLGDYARIPERMQESIKRYLIDRLRPGDFLAAVIQNDLRNSIMRADGENLELIPLYVGWFYNRAPAQSHGSPEAFVKWISSDVQELRHEAETRLGAGPVADAVVDYGHALTEWAQDGK